jgi:Xaa-Pro aminopeptidase
MDPDLGPLDAFLDDAEHDGYLIDDCDDPDAYYLAGFDAPDPYVTLFADDAVHLLVSGLEYGRAKRTSRAATVRRLSEFDYRNRVAATDRATARCDVVAAFLAEHGIDGVAVPGRFPAFLAEGLRARDVAVECETDGVIDDARAVKTDAEVELVRDAQRATEAAIGRAESLLAAADSQDGVLHHDGAPLTSERVKRVITHELLDHECECADVIVAGGEDAADPHERGSGPLPADAPIIVDVFPRSTDSRYHADTTRTFVVGEPSAAAREFHELTCEALEAALDAIGPGVTGSSVHDAACEVYEAAGFETSRGDASPETGFIHGTGHGVGLAIHEEPRLSATADDELAVGNVVTVEPGLYDPEVGGVRVEELVVVREDGPAVLTDYHRDLVL